MLKLPNTASLDEIDETLPPRFFQTIHPTIRAVCPLPAVTVAEFLGGQQVFRTHQLGTVEVLSRPTRVEGYAAKFLEKDPFFNDSFREVFPGERDKARETLDKGPSGNEYSGVEKGDNETAATYLRAHGAQDEELRDKLGRLNMARIKKAARKYDVSFPNYG
jgi:hypothetical protein